MSEVEGVRDYDRIRRYLRYIYLYGFLSREDFSRLDIGSVKDYDYGVKLIRSVFPESHEDARWEAGKKYLRIRREHAKSGEDPMTDSYLLHTLDTREELPMLLCLLAALDRKPAALRELCRRVELRWGNESVSKYATLRKRLLELWEYGYAEKSGSSYRLAGPLPPMSDGELASLYDFVRFSSGAASLKTPASFLRRSLERELLRRGMAVPRESPFLLRHLASAGIFDESLVLQLLDLVDRHRYAVLETGRGPLTVLPVGLRLDTRLGRWYLLTLEDRPRLRRVSTIRRAKPGVEASPEAWQAAADRVREAFSCAIVSGLVPEEGPVTVEIRLCFAGCPGLEAQFVRELRLGEIVTREDGSYYVARVNDPTELIPLLRSYAPWLRILPGEHHLDETIRESLLEMKKALEVPDGTTE